MENFKNAMSNLNLARTAFSVEFLCCAKDLFYDLFFLGMRRDNGGLMEK